MEKAHGDQLTDLVRNLQHKSPSMRRRAIKDISSWLQKQNNTNIPQIFERQLSAPITNLILDHSESIREATLQLLLEIFTSIGTSFNMEYMKTFLTVIWQQLGCHESMCSMMVFKSDDCDDFKTINATEISTHKEETSEEIRILIVELLSKIVTNNYDGLAQFLQNSDKKYCFEYLNILHLLFSDNCPQIRTKISQLLLKQIVEYEKCTNNGKNDENKFFKCIFDEYAEYLCSPVAKGCMHQRGRIRLISFELLSKIIENNIIIKKEISSWITDDQKIWKYISYLTFDQMQYIKKAISSGACKWISLLITLKNNNNLNCIQCAKIWMLLLNEYGLNILDQQEQFNTRNELLQCLSFIITLCCQQINHWQSIHRLFGIKALVSLTLCLKYKLPSQYIVKLLPNFISLIECQNDEIVTQTNKCLKLFGTFLPLKYYSDFLFSKFDDHISIKSYLTISAQIFTGYNDMNINDKQLLKICKSLSNSSFVQNNQDDDVGIKLLNTVINLLLTYNKKDESNFNSECILEILWLTLQTHAGYLQNHDSSLSSLSIPNCENLYEQISKVISLLTKYEDNNNETKSNNTLSIWQEHFDSLYERICSRSIKFANTYYLFGSLVYYSKEFISQYMSSILPVFTQCNNEKNTEIIRYSVLSILHSLLKDTINNTKNVWGNYTQPIAFEILLPNIVWKSGQFRLKMRSLSLDCMLILYKNNNCADRNITWAHREKLISTLKSRLDDSEYFIRSVTVELFGYILSNLCLKKTENNSHDEIINKSELSLLCQCILDRLDDSKDEIRILTCSTLQSFVQCMMSEQNIDLYANIIATSLIHLDDSNDKLQQAVFAFLKKASHFNEKIFQTQLKSVDTNNMQARSQEMIQKLSKQLN